MYEPGILRFVAVLDGFVLHLAIVYNTIKIEENQLLEEN